MPLHEMPDTSCPDFPGACECPVPFSNPVRPYGIRMYRVQVSEFVVIASSPDEAVSKAMEGTQMHWEITEKYVDKVFREDNGLLIQEEITKP